MANEGLRDPPSDLRRVALSLATFGLVGFSVVLACQTGWLASPLRTLFAERNTLGVQSRTLLLLSLLTGVALPALIALFVLWRTRRVALLERAATLTAPLALLFVVPGLFLSQLAEDKPLYYLIVLSAFGVLFEHLLASALALRSAGRGSVFGWRGARLRIPRAVPALVVAACASGYAWLLGRYATLHHRLIQDVAADVGVRDNVMANLLHGHYFQAPAYFGTAAGNWLTVHAEYGSLLLVPLYALRPGASTLLWLQAAIAGSAVWPLYLVAAQRLGRGTALWVCLAYLLVAPQQGALLVGFSWLPAVTLLSFFSYYAIQSRRHVLLALCLLALLCMSEVGPLNVLGLGFMLIASRTRLRIGVLLVALAAPVIALNFALSQRVSAFVDAPPLLSAVTTLCRNPVYFVWDLARAVKVTSMLHALAPISLLPLLELACWPLLIPGLLFTSAGTQFWPNAPSNFMDSVVWVPGCFIALLYVLDKRRRAGARNAAVVVTLTITLLSHGYNYGALLRADSFAGVPPSAVRMTPWGQARYDNLQAVLAHIPGNASVGVTTFLLSHVSHRPKVFDLSRPSGEPDFILVSSREVSAVHSALESAFGTHKYQLEISRFDEFYLFRRGNENPETRLALTRLGFPAP